MKGTRARGCQAGGHKGDRAQGQEDARAGGCKGRRVQG